MPPLLKRDPFSAHLCSRMSASIHSFTHACVRSLASSPLGCGFHRSRSHVPVIMDPALLGPSQVPLDSEERVVEGDRTEGPAARASSLRVSLLMMNPPGPTTESYCDYAGFLGLREREKN